MRRGALPLALHEEAFSCLLNSVGQLGSGLPCSVDPRVWLLDEVVKCLKERKSVVQVNICVYLPRGEGYQREEGYWLLT